MKHLLTFFSFKFIWLLTFSSQTADTLNVQRYDSNKSFSLKAACGHDQLNRKHPSKGRVLGGDAVKFGEFPWITSIQSVKGQHFCAGFMVSSRFLISAAHCFHQKFNDHIRYKEKSMTVRLDSFKVVLNRVNFSDNTEPVKIIEVIDLTIHPEFDEKELNNDIAIIELKDEMEGIKASNLICLPEIQNDDQGEGDVTVAGWGYRQCGLAKSSNELHKITVPLWNAKECKRAYEDADYNFNRSKYVCAGSDGKDTTRGDSGGPLMFQNSEKQWIAIGIVSSGKFMCSDGVPGVYTEVSSYLDWIKDYIT